MQNPFRHFNSTPEVIRNTPSPYQLIALLEFGSVEEFQAAVADSGDEVLGDIPNFTGVQPVIQINDNIA